MSVQVLSTKDPAADASFAEFSRANGSLSLEQLMTKVDAVQRQIRRVQVGGTVDHPWTI